MASIFKQKYTVAGDNGNRVRKQSASWYIDCPSDFIPGNPTGVEGSGFIAGRYQEEYIREDGLWKWKKIIALLDLQTGFSDNWQGAKQIQNNR